MKTRGFYDLLFFLSFGKSESNSAEAYLPKTMKNYTWQRGQCKNKDVSDITKGSNKDIKPTTHNFFLITSTDFFQLCVKYWYAFSFKPCHLIPSCHINIFHISQDCHLHPFRTELLQATERGREDFAPRQSRGLA